MTRRARGPSRAKDPKSAKGSREPGSSKTRNARGSGADSGAIQGEPLEPIGVVERELTRPDGSKVVVEVPVYPPFRLLDRERAPGRTPAPRKRSAPTLRARRSGGAKGG